MKISKILYEEFKHAPTLSEFVDFVENWNCEINGYLTTMRKAHNIALFEFILKYNNFLKQPIELKMLVPCKDGKVLDKTLHEKLCKTGKTFGIKEQQKCYEYQKAKEDVLFSGFRDVGKTDVVHIFRNKAVSVNFYYLNPSDEPNTKPIEFLTAQPITENYFKFLD